MHDDLITVYRIAIVTGHRIMIVSFITISRACIWQCTIIILYRNKDVLIFLKIFISYYLIISFFLFVPI